MNTLLEEKEILYSYKDKKANVYDSYLLFSSFPKQNVSQ